MLAGLADLALAGRKVSGNAQRRGRCGVLHHGTVLYDFDASLAERYLLEPPRQPDYRAGRSHQAFLGNLPLSGDVVRQRIQTACLALVRSSHAVCAAPEHMHNDADVPITTSPSC